jgi:uncharacterized protein with PIN domain
MIEIVEITDERENPICPHCEKEIKTLNAKKIASFLGVRYIYYCAKCRKTLGVSQRKGFWMG